MATVRAMVGNYRIGDYGRRGETFTIVDELPKIGTSYNNELVTSIHEVYLKEDVATDYNAFYDYYELEVFDEASYYEDFKEFPDEDIWEGNYKRDIYLAVPYPTEEEK